MITLLPYQIAHIETIFERFFTENWPVVMDLSALGAGKTFTSAYIAKVGGFQHTIVIAPLTTLPKWNLMRTMHGMPAKQHHLMTYAAARTQAGGLLNKEDRVPSDEYREMVDRGTLLIIDEFQMIKNKSAQQAACQALIKPIVDRQWQACREARPPFRSRVLLLSGSPVDKIEQVFTLYRTLGIWTRPTLVNFRFATREYLWEEAGAGEIISLCREYDEKTTNSICRSLLHYKHSMSVAPGENTFKEMFYTLFLQVLKPRISSACQPPSQEMAQLIRYNAFYELRDPDGKQKALEAVRNLKNATMYDPFTREVQFYGGSGQLDGSIGILAQITRCLIEIESAKTETFFRVASEYLLREPLGKVVLCFNYKTSIKYLLDKLQTHFPKTKVLSIDGSVSLTKRAEILQTFSADSDEARILVGNLAVLSTGIDLDDKAGRRPRFCLVSPNYHCINLYQLSYRFLRQDTKSSSCVHMVYAKGEGMQELCILDALSRKGSVMKAMAGGNQCRTIVYPCEYESWIEQD